MHTSFVYRHLTASYTSAQIKEETIIRYYYFQITRFFKHQTLTTSQTRILTKAQAYVPYRPCTNSNLHISANTCNQSFSPPRQPDSHYSLYRELNPDPVQESHSPALFRMTQNNSVYFAE